MTVGTQQQLALEILEAEAALLDAHERFAAVLARGEGSQAMSEPLGDQGRTMNAIHTAGIELAKAVLGA